MCILMTQALFCSVMEKHCLLHLAEDKLRAITLSSQ